MKKYLFALLLIYSTHTLAADTITLKSPALSHPFTFGFNLYFDEHTYGYVLPQDPIQGGLVIDGMSDGDMTALRLTGYIGTVNPTQTALRFTAAKSNGEGWITPLLDHEKLAEFVNVYPRVTIFGDGSIDTLGSIKTPAITLHSRPLNTRGADLTASNVMLLGDDGDYFRVIGSAQVDGIAANNIADGMHITLFFTDTVVLTHDASPIANADTLYLSNLQNVKGQFLVKFVKDGGYWVEESRVVFQ